MKRFPLYLTEEEVNKLKRAAKKEHLSVNGMIKNKMLSEMQETPNLSTGDWWHDANRIITAIEKLKEKRK